MQAAGTDREMLIALDRAPKISLPLDTTTHSAVGVAWADVATQFGPGRVHGMTRMVPGQSGTDPITLIIQRYFILDILELFARMFLGCFDTSPIRRGIMFGRDPFLRVGLLIMF